MYLSSDLNSSNVLVDGNGEAYVTDYGLSVVTNGHKYIMNGEDEKIAEYSSLAEAGTLRYLSPELLEGCVNLKDCENSLKQADVYSLALVIWETANTCQDLLNDNSIINYTLPYEIELGKYSVVKEPFYGPKARPRPTTAS